MVTGMPALAFLASALADRASLPSRLRPRRVRYWPEVLVGVTLRGREIPMQYVMCGMLSSAKFRRSGRCRGTRRTGARAGFEVGGSTGEICNFGLVLRFRGVVMQHV